MAKMSDHPQGAVRSSYSSEAMKQRRERILEETRRLLTEEGYDGLAMRKLAKRAGVAATTLFNIFGSKESLVAEAVHDRFDAISVEAETHQAVTIADLVEHESWVVSTILDNGAYARAMVILYFSGSAQNQVAELLRKASGRPFRTFLAQAQGRQGLADWADPDIVARMISNQLFAVVHDWAIGEIPDASLGDHMTMAFALILSSVLTGKDRRQVEALLQSLADRVGYRAPGA